MRFGTGALGINYEFSAPFSGSDPYLEEAIQTCMTLMSIVDKTTENEGQINSCLSLLSLISVAMVSQAATECGDATSQVVGGHLGVARSIWVIRVAAKRSIHE